MSQGGWGQPPRAQGGWGSPPPNDGNQVPPMPLGMPPGHLPGSAGAPVWTPMEALWFGWDRVKADPVPIIVAILVGGLVIGLPNMLSGLANTLYETAAYGTGKPDPFDPISLSIRGGGALLQSITSALITGGMTLFSLRVARGEPYRIGDIFSRFDLFGTMFVAQLLMALGISAGLLFLIVPGVVLALAWSLTILVAVDRGVGPVEALSQSWKLTDGHKGNIFVLWLIFFGLALVCTFCTCCLGWLVLEPVILVAFASVYLRITGQQTATMQPASQAG